MIFISQTIYKLLPSIYISALFIYALIFFGRLKRPEKYTHLVLIILLTIHGIGIFTRGVYLNQVPLTSKYDALSFIAFAIVFIYLFLEINFKNKATGFIVLVLPFLFVSITSIYSNWMPINNKLLQNQYFIVHVIMTLIGYTALSISAIYALMYVLLNHNLKKRKLGLVYKNLPSLMLLEKMSIRSVQIGIILLGIGIFHGHLRSQEMIGYFWPNDLKIYISDAIWVIYAVGLLVTTVKNWRGIKMAVLSIAVFIILVVSNVLMHFYSDTFHQFY